MPSLWWMLRQQDGHKKKQEKKNKKIKIIKDISFNPSIIDKIWMTVT
jgi:hypothetical protein